MAVRICPHCGTEIKAFDVVACSFGFDCPKCGTRLEVSTGSRWISSLCGFVAGAIAWRLSNHSGGDLGAVLPTLYAFLAFGIVSPIVLLLTANLRNAPPIPAFETLHGHVTVDHSVTSHATGGDASGHH